MRRRGAGAGVRREQRDRRGGFNAARAVAGTAGYNVLEEELANDAEVDEYTFEVVPGRNEVKVTLTWDDPAGDPALSPSTIQLVNDLFSRGDALCTCSIVIVETYSGLRHRDRPRGDELFESMTTLATTPNASRQAGIWRYDFARRGQQLSTAVCLIAAIAHDHGATLLTGNVDHFPMEEIHLLPIPRRLPRSK